MFARIGVVYVISKSKGRFCYVNQYIMNIHFASMHSATTTLNHPPAQALFSFRRCLPERDSNALRAAIVIATMS